MAVSCFAQRLESGFDFAFAADEVVERLLGFGAAGPHAALPVVRCGPDEVLVISLPLPVHASAVPTRLRLHAHVFIKDGDRIDQLARGVVREREEVHWP